MTIRIYVDVETTGFSRSAGAVIVEAAAIVRSEGTEIARYQSICNPGEEALALPDALKALEVNRIPKDEILAAAPTADVAEGFRAFLTLHGPGAQLFAFNQMFDSKFLEDPPWAIAKDRWGPCLMIMAKKAMGLGVWPSLEKAAAHFRVTPPGQHRALADARVAAELHEAILAVQVAR